MCAPLTLLQDEKSNNLMTVKKVPGSTAHLFYLCALNDDRIVPFVLYNCCWGSIQTLLKTIMLLSKGRI